MGWQDSPLVDGTAAPAPGTPVAPTPAWASAPVVRVPLARNPDGSLDMTDPAVQAAVQAQQAADAVQYNPTGTTTDNLLSGVGKAFTDTYHGAQQIGASVLDNTLGRVGLGASPTLSSLITGQTPTYRAPIDAQVNDQAQLDQPLMATTSGKVGDLAGNVALGVAPLGVAGGLAKLSGAVELGNALRVAAIPKTIAQAAGSGAAQGALQPTTDDGSRLLNTGLGTAAGAVGQGIAKGIGLIAQPVTNVLAPYAQKAVQTLQDAGVPLDMAQVSGSPLLNRIRSSFSDNIGTMGAQSAANDAQQTAFNRAALNTIGENADAATPDVMSAARDRIGQVFDDVAARNDVAYDNPLQSALATIETNAVSVLNDAQMQPIKNQLNTIVTKAANNGGSIDGAAYQNLKQNLDQIATGDDPTKALYARQIRGALDDALQRSTQANGNPEDYASLLQARQQWGNLQKIAGTIDRDGSADISPAKLTNVLAQKSNQNTSVYGQGDQSLVNLAQAGKQLLGDSMPNSGTAARLAMQVIPSVLGAAGGAGYEYLNGDASIGGIAGSAAKYAALGYAVPKAAQMLMSTQRPWIRNYLAEGLSNPAARNALLAPSSDTLLGGAFRNLPVSGSKDAVSAYQNGNALAQ